MKYIENKQKQPKKQNKQQNNKKTLWQIINEYNKTKWKPPKQQNISILCILSLIGLFKPKQKYNDFEKFKKY